MAAQALGIADYVSLCLMMTVSAVIGVYAACSGDRQKTSAEYLLANRRMNFIMAGVSIMVSVTSAISLVTVPAEMYLYGTTAWWRDVGTIMGATLVAFTILPIFYRLKLTSIYTVIKITVDSEVTVLSCRPI